MLKQTNELVKCLACEISTSLPTKFFLITNAIPLSDLYWDKERCESEYSDDDDNLYLSSEKVINWSLSL